MSSQHKAPLAAFLVVSIACVVVVVNALRSDALSGLFTSPTQAVVAGARLVPQPQDILSTEAKVVVGATAGLKVVPDVVRAVANTAGHAAAKSKHTTHRGTVHGTAAIAIAPEAPAPPQSSGDDDATGTAAQQTHPTLPEVSPPSYGHSGPRGSASPASYAPIGWSRSSSKSEDRRSDDSGDNGHQDRSSRHEGHHRSGHAANGWARTSNDRSSRSSNGARSQGRSGNDHANGYRGDGYRGDGYRNDGYRSGNDRGHGDRGNTRGYGNGHGNGWGNGNGRHGRA